MKEIIITVSEEGEIELETKGFKGAGCLKESEFLKSVLGKETSKQLTPAYREKAGTKSKTYLNLCG